MDTFLNIISSPLFYFVGLVPAMILAIWAQIRVKTTFNKYSGISNSRGITGAQAARALLDTNGLSDVEINVIPGDLNNFYDPRTNSLSLSQAVYSSTSIAAIGIAAHEVGHAIQSENDYLPLKVRSALVPVVNFTSRTSMLLIVIGLLFSAFAGSELGWYISVLGVIFFAFSTIFHLVTLPLELNASGRAKKQLREVLAISDESMRGVNKMLSAAALTYVAALTTSIINLLRLIGMVSRGRR